MKKNIILTAENFAFGPIGKLLTVAEKINKEDYSLTFVGYGTAYQLAKSSSIRNVLEINTDSSDFTKLAGQSFDKADLIISCMDRSSIRLAQSLNKPTIWLDTLFWWWDEIPKNICNVDIYLKQNSINDSKNLKRYGEKIKNLKSVGPIVDLDSLINRSINNQALVNYGGMEAAGWYQVGKDSNYPYVITELLVKKVDFSSFDKVIFTGNERIISELDKKYGNSKFIFKTLPHRFFTQELANSKLVLTTPGLETPLESFTYQVPTIFLPPSNSSQYVQIDDFNKNGAAYMALHFKDYYLELNFKDKNLKEMMVIFLEELKRFENDRKALENVSSRINDFISNKQLQVKQVEGQKKYLERVGKNGLNSALEIINSFLKI